MELPESNINKEKDFKGEKLPNKFYATERLNNKVSLRKRKINEIISRQRGLERYKSEGNKEYEIDKEKLEIEKEIKNKIYEDIEIFIKEMKKYIKNENKELNKYSLYCLRVQLNDNNNSNNKSYLSEELQNKDFISDILNLFQKYIEDKQIIFEGLWIFINILYYTKDISDLCLFFSNQNCINLYLKILDKKDNILRFHIYWLISNILCNDKVNITQEVLFHLYMSPFFRLYLFKDLEDKNSKLTEKEYINIFNILSQLSSFINDTFICLRTNNIQQFINYNNDVDFNAIQENNNFLFYHSMKQFMDNININKITFSCIYGLSKLTNFLDDSTAYNEFFKTGICRKLVKQEIKYDEDCLSFVVQIIGNYLSVTDEQYIDDIFLDEILNFFVKLLQSYPERQYLKRDIFWSSSNISSGNIYLCEKFAKSGLLELILQSIYTDNDIALNEALYTLLGFFDKQNIEIIVKYHHLDYIKNLTLCLKNIKNRTKPGEQYLNMDIIERILICIGFLFEDGDLLKGNLDNKFVVDFEKNGGFELVENILSDNILNEKTQNIAENLLNFRII